MGTDEVFDRAHSRRGGNAAVTNGCLRLPQVANTGPRCEDSRPRSDQFRPLFTHPCADHSGPNRMWSTVMAIITARFTFT